MKIREEETKTAMKDIIVFAIHIINKITSRVLGIKSWRKYTANKTRLTFIYFLTSSTIRISISKSIQDILHQIIIFLWLHAVKNPIMYIYFQWKQDFFLTFAILLMHCYILQSYFKISVIYHFTNLIE